MRRAAPAAAALIGLATLLLALLCSADGAATGAAAPATANVSVHLAAAGSPCAPGGTVFPLKRWKAAYVCLTLGDKRMVVDTTLDGFRTIDIAGCE